MSIRVAWVVLLASVFNSTVPAAEKAVQDTRKISCELCFVSVPEAFLERTGVDLVDLRDGSAVLSGDQLRKFVEAAQIDPPTRVIQTMSSPGHVEPMSCGDLTLTARPTVEEDGQSVKVSMRTVWAGSGKSRNWDLCIPKGFTGVLVVGQRCTFDRIEDSPPALSKIPFISRLFTNVGYGPERMTALVLLTPRLSNYEARQGVAPAGLEEASEPEAKKADTKLEKLLKQYEQACESGDKDKAHKIARKALKIDPTCFSKQLPGCGASVSPSTAEEDDDSLRVDSPYILEIKEQWRRFWFDVPTPVMPRCADIGPR